MNITYQKNCRICYGELTDFLNLGHQPNQGTFVYKDDKLPTPRRSSELIIAKCNDCSLVQNRYIIPPEILYCNYGYESSISESMSSHLIDITDKVKKLIPEQELAIIECGANDGLFLNQFKQARGRTAIDPSDIVNNIKDEKIKIINDVFPCDIDNTCNLFCALACFYDVQNPREFIQKSAELLMDDGIILLEFAYLPLILTNLCYDGLVFEHLCHYSLATVEILLKEFGLKVFDLEINNVNGGSLQLWITKRANDKYDSVVNKLKIQTVRINEYNAELDKIDTYFDFAQRVSNHKSDLVKLLVGLIDKGANIHILGMSTKLQNILNYCRIDSKMIQYAAERNPKKWGGETLNGIKMISEQASKDLNPTHYLVGPYHFKQQIIDREQKFIKNGGKLIFPLPKIEVYP